MAGRPRRERVLERLHRAARRRGRRRQPRGARRASPRRSPRSRAPSRASATSTRRCRSTIPRCASRPTATRPALVGVTRAQRRADHARGDARQHQHAQRLDRRRERPVVLRRHRPTTAASSTIPNALARIPVRIGENGGAVTLGAYGDDPPLGRPDRDRAQPPAARRARADADRGARHRQRRRASSSERLARRSADPRHRLQLRRAGRSDADDVLRPRARASGSPSWSCS